MKSSTPPISPFRVPVLPSSTTASNGSNIFGSSILRPSILAGKVTTTVDSVSSPPVSREQSLPVNTQPSLPPPVFSSTAPTIAVAPSNSEYVFGQNMFSRVVNAAQTSSSSSNLWQAASSVSGAPTDKEAESSNSPAQSSSVFTVLAKAVASNNSASAATVASDHPVELKESADELVRKRNLAQIKLTEAPSMTGEEGERIALQFSCNAYVFNTESRQWTSLGQSYLHLNDELSDDRKSVTGSRFILRLQSTRRVLINTRIWPEMPISTAEAKGVRLGALDADGTSIRTYLLRFPSAQNACRLYEALVSRKQESAFTQTKRQRLSKDHCEAPPPLPSAPPTPAQPTATTAKPVEEAAIPVVSQCSETVPTYYQSSHPEQKTSQSSPEISVINVPPSAGSGTTVFNLKCSALFCDDPGRSSVAACVRITEYSHGNQSVLEIRSLDNSSDASFAASLLTVTIGFRLAFCFCDERSLRLFVPASTATAVAGSAEGSLEEAASPRVNSFIVQMDTRQEAERLFRCLLLRINRLFMENQPVLSSSANSSNTVRESMTDSSACQDENSNSVSLA